MLAALAVLLLLPAFAGSEAQNSQPYNVTAEAGRSLPGHRWCECGTQDCICDPGQTLTVQQNNPPESEPTNSIDLGAAFSLAVAAAVLVLRLRQI